MSGFLSRGLAEHLAERGRGRPDGTGRSAMGALAHHAVPSAETPIIRSIIRSIIQQ
jgi:hypothetical protein